MDKTIIYMKLFLAGTLSIIIKFLGGWDIALETLITLVILDFMTGIIVAIVGKALSSKIATRGIAKKIGVFTLIAVVVAGENVLGQDGLREVVIGFFIISEIVSIVENWANFGLPIPAKLREILAELNEKQLKQ